MRDNVETMSRAEWKDKTQEIGQQKDELSTIMSHFEYEAILELNRKLSKRKQKRAAIRKRKEDRKFRKERTLELSIEKEKLIDQALEDERKVLEMELEVSDTNTFLKSLFFF